MVGRREAALNSHDPFIPYEIEDFLSNLLFEGDAAHVKFSVLFTPFEEFVDDLSS